MPSVNVRVYECSKGVKRVQGLQNEYLIGGDKLGVLPASISALLGEHHIEFSVVLEGRKNKNKPTSETFWLGFHFFGQFPNLQKCFKKQHTDLASIYALIHKNLTTKFEDPYVCPLLIIGEGSMKAFWQIVHPENPDEVLGFIPLHRTELFHTLNSYPIIFMEEIDTLHMQTLKQLYSLFKSQKWCCVVLPEQLSDKSGTDGIPTTADSSKSARKFDLSSVASWLAKEGPLTLANNIAIWRKGNVKEVELLSINTNSESSGFDIEKCKHVFDKLVEDIKELKALTANGTCIYNPFLAKSRGISNPVVVESHTLKLSNTSNIAALTIRNRAQENSTTSETASAPQWQDPGILQSGSPIYPPHAKSQIVEGLNINVLASALATVLSLYQ